MRCGCFTLEYDQHIFSPNSVGIPIPNNLSIMCDYNSKSLDLTMVVSRASI